MLRPGGRAPRKIGGFNPVSGNVKLGRNDACICGSGKKYKHCCWPTEAPQSAEAWRALAQALWRQGKDAMPALQETARLLPNDADALGNLATALLSRGQPSAALPYYHRALALRPDFAEGHNNLGSALRELGRLEQAAQSYRRALTLNPNLAVAHCNLAHVLRLQGEFGNAVAHYRAAVRLQPQLADAHTGLGNTLQDLGQNEQALESHGRTLQLKPHAADSHFYVGNALLDSWRPEEAEASYRRALQLRPDYAEAHDKLSVALRQQGRAAEAQASCRRALELSPQLAEALINAAQLSADSGEFAEAESALRQAIALQPESAEAMAGIAGLRKMTAADAGWAEQARRLAGVTQAPRRAAKLRYAIGKYFDDIGDADQAFGNYRAANELSKLGGAAHDRGRIEHEVDSIIGTFDRAWIERHRDARQASPRPVLVIGMPRSGTTLVEQILGAHPAMYAAGELGYWVPALRRYLAAADAADPPHTSLERLAEAYLRLLDRSSTAATRVIDKMPMNFLCLGLIHAALPQARMIHVMRHPIDTCLSIYFQDFNAAHAYANDLDDMAHYYRQYRRLMDHWRATLPAEALLEIAYEDLVDEPENRSRALVDFVGMPWSPRCLEFDSVNRSANAIMTFSQWQARQKISKASVARWRKYERFVAPLLPLAEESPGLATAAARGG